MLNEIILEIVKWGLTFIIIFLLYKIINWGFKKAEERKDAKSAKKYKDSLKNFEDSKKRKS